MNDRIGMILGGGASGGGGSISADAVNTNGAYLYRTAALIGAAASRKWTFSFWIKPLAIGATQRILEIISATGTNPARINLASSGKINVTGTNSLGSTILNLTGSTVLSAGTLYHVAGAIDMTDAAKRLLYINRAADTLSVSTYANSALQFAGANVTVFADHNGAGLYTGDVGRLYVDLNEYLDISVAANLNALILADGTPADMGGDGSNPLGSTPDIYLNGNSTTFQANLGAGGAFGVNGALAAGTTVLRV